MDFSEKESDFLSEKQKQAINDALQNLKEGKIYTHERVTKSSISWRKPLHSPPRRRVILK